MNSTKTLKKVLQIFLPGIIIVIVMLAFHSRLFFPNLSLYVTPDHARSDAWHLSVANKFYYAQQLKENKIPIWNPHIGMGYPTLAEGQTAIFFPPNLILFRILPFVWAYNITLVFSFVLAGWGTYLFARSIGLGKIASTYSGIIFPLGGFFVFHVQHHNLLQTASITPWLFWATNEFIKKKSTSFLCLLSLLVALQLFAGFPQIVAYSLSFVMLYFIIHAWKFNKNKYLYSIFFLISIFAGFLIAAIQLLPTAEFLSNSDKTNNPKEILEDFPYKMENLKQFINPYILGSPKDGSYPGWIRGQRGVFWENSAYVGLIPLILFAALSFALFRKNFENKKLALISILSIVISLSLALGKDLPLHPIFAIPPFSIFRVPSRFLLLTQFFMVISSALLVEQISKKKIISVLIFIAATLNLFIVYYTYNPIGNMTKWLEPPEVVTFLKQYETDRVVSLGQFAIWDKIFREEGWKDLGFYYFSRNSVDANSNLIFNLDQVQSYESLLSKRASAINSLITTGIKIDDQKITLEPRLVPLLESFGTQHIITPNEITNESLPLTFTTKYKDHNMHVYKLDGTSPKFSIYDNYSLIELPSEIISKMVDINFNLKENVILENNPQTIEKLNKSDSQVEVLHESTRKTILKTKSSHPFVLVLKQSYFPGWESSINSTKTQIIPANLNFQAVVVPKGENQVLFEYKPKSLYLGAFITLTTSLFITIILLKNRPLFLKRFLRLPP